MQIQYTTAMKRYISKGRISRWLTVWAALVRSIIAMFEAREVSLNRMEEEFEPFGSDRAEVRVNHRASSHVKTIRDLEDGAEGAAFAGDAVIWSQDPVRDLGLAQAPRGGPPQFAPARFRRSPGWVGRACVES